MDEQTKQRLRHIRDATEVNARHKQDLTRDSLQRHERARVQINSEVMENRNINYCRCMELVRMIIKS
ncbi:hypothetical protein EFN88_05070 [Leuconostoc citreum]|nr:hypothetical protein [Leuconostoc citreum]MCQ6659579.1 hypothetical protein [Leuconostoc citreum]MCT3079728.1 hypothetical protein [Leuconostoc citreum]MCT3080377.1 hypothetical protein [Leuconostoc citreum]MCT3082688.1 hypothetical protein [Leuconostoc citreum]QEA36787.1 hypothetical protein FGL87_05415 [Leuconostoc citreum]